MPLRRFFLTLLAFIVVAMVNTETANAAETKYKTYTDEKFGYSMEYPDIYNKTQGPFTIKENGYRVFGAYSSTSGGDGKYAFDITGGKKPKGANGNALLKEATTIEEDKFGYVYGVEALPGTAKSDANFYTLQYIDDSFEAGSVRHVYCVIGKDVMVTYWIRIPKEETERFAEITKRMDASLKVK